MGFEPRLVGYSQDLKVCSDNPKPIELEILLLYQYYLTYQFKIKNIVLGKLLSLK